MKDKSERSTTPISAYASNRSFYAGEIWLIRKLKILNSSYNKTKNKYKFPASYVAKMFNVSPTTISRIWNSKTFICREGYYV